MTSFFYPQTSQSRLSFWLVAIALLSGLVLSYLSLIEFCVEHCSANQDYRLLGLPFAYIGMIAFPLVLLFHLLSEKYPPLATFRNWIICGAFGSEIVFILVQEYEIGAWCPVCISIAACVGVAALILFVGYVKNFLSALNQSNKGEVMNKIKQGLTSISFILIGFLLAFVGVSKVNPAEAAAAEIKDRLAFGKKGTPVEFYFISDWYCKACRKTDPIIEKLYPDLRTQATVFFIDYPIHKKSVNFAPYNISFLINNKSQYFQARHALHELTDSEDAPTDKDVEAIAKKYNLTYKELPYLDVKTASDFFEKMVEQFGLNSTPVVVITNTKTKKLVKLEGNDITEEKVKKALEEVNPGKKY